MTDSSNIYVSPEEITDIADCCFYHTMDIPGHGTMEGTWDLRKNVNKYLGKVDYSGKRVLDVGKASGYLSFTIESMRASEVIAFDLDGDKFSRDWVPYPGEDTAKLAESAKDHHRMLTNSFWLAHKAYGSEVKLVFGSGYHIPQAIGKVDVALLGSILLHTRSPFEILHSATRLSPDTVVVADIPPKTIFRLPRINFLPGFIKKRMKPYALFFPEAETKVQGTWWSLSPELIVRFLEVLGYTSFKTIYHLQTYNKRPVVVYTVVGQR
jgi:hypothetical protein